MPATNLRLNTAFVSPLGSLIVDPSIRVIVDEIVDQMKQSVVVATTQGRAPAGQFERAVLNLLATRAPFKVQRLQQRVAVLRAQQATKAKLTLEQFLALSRDQQAAHMGKLHLNVPVLKLKLKPEPIFKLPPPVDPDVKAGKAFKMMKLFIRRARCLEETDEIGSDEIAMGGTVTDAFGNTGLVKEFMIHNDFDEGENKDFGWSQPFCSWSLQTKNEGFPYVYSSVLALAEKDDGGFWKFLQELWSKVKTAIEEAVGAAVGAAIGAAIGSAFSPIGTIVCAIVGAAIGYIVDWLLSVFGGNGDDPIRTIPLTMTLGSCKKSYYDWAKLTSPEGFTSTLNFNGDGGRYQIDVAYRIFT